MNFTRLLFYIGLSSFLFISTKLLKKSAFKDNKHKITIFDQKDAEDVDFYAMTESLNQVISDITSK